MQTLPFPELRVGTALLFLLVGSYFDIFKDKNIPDKLLYAFVAVSFVVSIVAFDQFSFVYGLAQALIIGLITYISYKKGHIGGAEVFYFAGLSMLLPFYNSIIPFIVPVLIFSTLLFAIVMALYSMLKLMHKKNLKPNYIYLLLVVLYIGFLAYFYTTPASSIINNAFILIVSVLFIASVYFGMFKKDIEELMVGYVDVEKAKEEVVVHGLNKKVDSIMGKDRVIAEKHIKEFKKNGIKKVAVFKHLPPFLPFLTIGFVLALLYENVLFLI